MRPASSKRLIVALIALVVFVYIRYYTIPSAKPEILQMPVASLDAKSLFEKLPIVLEDGIVDPIDFIHKAFKYIYVYKSITNGLLDSTVYQATARYTIVMSFNNDNIVTLKHPTQDTGINIQLRDHKCIIIPYRWKYACTKGEGTRRYELHDLITTITSRFHRKTP